MGKKIATIDAQVMNSLYASEFDKLAGTKLAKAARQDEKGAPHGVTAFEDHASYLAALKEAMKADEGQEFSPNDELTD